MAYSPGRPAQSLGEQAYNFGGAGTASLFGLPISSSPFTADFTLDYAQLMRDDPGRQIASSEKQAELDRQFSSKESAKNRAMTLAQMVDANLSTFSNMMTMAGQSAALAEYKPVEDYYKNLMTSGMYSPTEMENAFATQFETVGKGQRAALDQASNAARAGGARGTGALALNAAAINAQALGSAGQIKNQYAMQNAESKLQGAQGAASIAQQKAALQAAPTQESAYSFYSSNTKLPSMIAAENNSTKRINSNIFRK